jgi:hypothetical protein
VIETFRKVKESLAQTKYEIMADEAIATAERARDAAIRKVMEELKREAEQLARREDFAGAERHLGAYAGPFAEPTAGERMREAAAYRQRGAQRAEERAADDERTRARAAETLLAALAALKTGRTWAGAPSATCWWSTAGWA